MSTNNLSDRRFAVRRPRRGMRLVLVLGTLLAAWLVAPSVTLAATCSSAPVISQVEPRGADGPPDQFIELYNPDNCGGGGSLSLAGWRLQSVSATGAHTTLYTFPSGTFIGAKTHLLAATGGYTLVNYAQPSVRILSFPSDGTGAVALYNASGSLADAAVFGPGTGISEGSPLGGLSDSLSGSGQYAFVRRLAKTSSAHDGPPLQTFDNANDFRLVEPESTSPLTLSPAFPGTALTALEGSPGPDSSCQPPILNSGIGVSLLQPGTSASASPNREVIKPGSGVNGYATLLLRRTITNNTSSSLYNLRFRVSFITTDQNPAPPPSQAILRVLSSSPPIPPNPLALRPMTLEAPANSNADGGGLNASLTVPSINPNAQLAPGKSINVEFRLGAQEHGGSYSFYFNVEQPNQCLA